MGSPPCRSRTGKGAACSSCTRHTRSAGIDALADEVARALAGRSPLLVVIAEGARRFAGSREAQARGLAPRQLEVARTRGTELREIVLEVPTRAPSAG
jgi:hypothetical protein